MPAVQKGRAGAPTPSPERARSTFEVSKNGRIVRLKAELTERVAMVLGAMAIAAGAIAYVIIHSGVLIR